MTANPRLLERVLDAYRQGDLDECIRLVRTLVEAAPQATGPRQLLASLFASTFNGRQALAHYRRLLPQAVERGEVIRAIAFQKQIDVYQPPETLVPGRWGELQKLLRQRGLTFLAAAPVGLERPWSEMQLLSLPRPWFERIAAETRFDVMGIEPRVLDVESGTVWEVLAGRMRWSFALPDGRASAEALAAEGDAVHVDPGLATSARVSFVPELPVEALRFDAALARDLKLALEAGLQANAGGPAELTLETRALLPTRPRRHEDLDERAQVPGPAEGLEPLRLVPQLEDDSEQRPPGRDTGDWIEFGVLALTEQTPTRDGASDAERPATDGEAERPASGVEAERPATDGEAVTAHAVPDAAPAAPEERFVDLTLEPVALGGTTESPPSESALAPPVAEPSADAPSVPAEIEGVVHQPPPPLDAEHAPPDVPVEAVEDVDLALVGQESGSGADDIGSAPAAAMPVTGSAEEEPAIERRRHPRVVVSLHSRLALLRLSGSSVAPVRGQLGDLSTSGFSIRFATPELGSSRGALADAVVAVDLDLPGPQGPLRVAAQVRWLDVDEPEVARLGIEFVLLTEPDRRRIAGTLARAALAVHESERKAA